MTFGNKPGVNLTFVNPTPHNSLFTHILPVHDKDTTEKVVARIIKLDKGIKSEYNVCHGQNIIFVVNLLILSVYLSGTQAVELWRYVDPALGPRTIPNLNSPLAGKEQVPTSAVFNVDVSAGVVEVLINGKSIAVGSQIVYIVK